MKIKKYIMILILFFVIILGNEVLGAELTVYDKNGNKLNNNDSITVDVIESKLELKVAVELGLINSGVKVKTTVSNKGILYNAKFEEKKSEKRYYEWMYIAELSEGNTELTITADAMIDDEITLHIEVTNLNKKIDDGEKTKQDMLDAYKNVPGADASASEIDTFLKSTANVIEDLGTQAEKDEMWEKFEEKVSKELANKWYTTISGVGGVDGALYADSRETLFWYINENDSYKDKSDDLNKEFDDAVDATDDTIRDYVKILEKVEGERRKKNDKFNDVLDNINAYKPSGATESTELNKKAGIILNVITNIGIILSVLMPAILGVKYMLGSLEQRAEYKKDMVPYLVGAFLLFGIGTVLKILQAIGGGFNGI